jgi:hypothetical protein
MAEYKVGNWALVHSQDGYQRLVKVTRIGPSSVYVGDTRYRLSDGLEWGTEYAMANRHIRPLTYEEVTEIRNNARKEDLVSIIRTQCDTVSLRRMTLDKLEQLNAILGNM